MPMAKGPCERSTDAEPERLGKKPERVLVGAGFVRPQRSGCDDSERWRSRDSHAGSGQRTGCKRIATAAHLVRTASMFGTLQLRSG